MLTTGFHITSGNRVSGANDQATIELRIFNKDTADNTVLFSYPLTLAGGQYSVSIPEATTANWPDEIRAAIYVDTGTTTATKWITASDAFNFLARLGTQVQVASPVVGSTLTGSSQSFAFNDPDTSKTWRYDIWFFDGSTWTDAGSSVLTSPFVGSGFPTNGETLQIDMFRWEDGTSPAIDPNVAFKPDNVHRVFTGSYTAASAAGIDRTGMTSIVLPSADIARPNFTWGSIWSSGGLAEWNPSNTSNPYIAGGRDKIAVKTIDGLRALEMRHVPTNGGVPGTQNINGSARFPQSTTRCKIAYRIFFPTGYDFGSVSFATQKTFLGIRSEVDAVGNIPQPTGFSARPIIRRFNNVEYYAGYLYDATTTGSGDDYLTSVPVRLNEWVEVALEVIMNSAYGASDGIFRMWVDGVLEVELTNVNWIGQQPSGGPAVPEIAGLRWDSFHGGSNNTYWEPANEMFPAYADIAVSRAA